MPDPTSRIIRFLIDRGYTYTVSDVLAEYLRSKEGGYLSHSARDCIEHLEPEIKALLEETEEESMKIKISFVLFGPGRPRLGTKTMSWSQIRLMKVGDRISFSGYTELYRVKTFAVNKGFSEGVIVVEQLPAKFNINLDEMG